MKIYYSTSCLNPKGETPKNLNFQTRRQIKSEYAISSKLAHVFDRANVASSVVFEIERAHASDADAQIFALVHAAQIHDASPAELLFEIDLNGASTRKFKMQTALPAKVKTQTDGISTVTSYEFTSTQTTEIL